jgi:hypothetical protein
MDIFAAANEVASWVNAHRGPSLAIGAGVVATGVLFFRDVWPDIRPARPVKHSPKVLASKARADESMRKLNLD